MQIRLRSDSIATTHEIGRAIGANIGPGDILLLSGGLGAGKTTLAQGIVWSLGATEYARSPTFVLVNEYQGRVPIYHMDLYRLDSFAEVDGLGLDDYLFGDGVCIVEWADKAHNYFPSEHILVSIDHVSESRRTFTVSSEAPGHIQLFDELRSLGQSRSALV